MGGKCSVGKYTLFWDAKENHVPEGDRSARKAIGKQMGNHRGVDLKYQVWICFIGSTIKKKIVNIKKVSNEKTFSAEKEGFEPPDLLQSTVFKTAAFDRSAISPPQKYKHWLNLQNQQSLFLSIEANELVNSRI